MSYTQRFGLSVIGGEGSAQIGDQGMKFGNDDRLVLDRILAALEGHTHEGGQRLADPTGSPSLVQLDVGGYLAGGTTYYYVVSYVDRYGLETRASAEDSITTPSRIATPGPPNLIALGGGSLSTGTYFYVLTTLKDGYETPMGPPSSITLIAGQGRVQLGLPPLPAGADSYGVWRQGPLESFYTKIGIASLSTIVDDGAVGADACPTDPAKLPPLQNQTNSTNSVIITVPQPELVSDPEGLIWAWRIYRTRNSGSYGPQSLVGEVGVVDPSTGALPTTFTDVGGALASGFPRHVSQTLTPSFPISPPGGDSPRSLLVGGAGEVWRIVSDTDGALVTRPSHAPAPDVDTWLISSDGTTWQLGVDTDGALVTTAGIPVPGDRVIGPGGWPVLPTPDPTVDYLLTVDDDGVLITVLL